MEQHVLDGLKDRYLLMCGALQMHDNGHEAWEECLIFYIDNVMTESERADFRYDPREKET